MSIEDNADDMLANNATVRDDFQGYPMNIPYVVSEGIVAITAVIGNALVIAAFYKTPALRQARNYYIVGLAAADLLVGLVGIPLAILNSVALPTSRLPCLFSLTTLIVLCIISICCLVGVSIDRIWATTNPITYHCKMNPSKAIGIIAICWCLGAVLGFLPLMGWYNHNGWESVQRCEFTKVISYNYLVFLYFTICLFPLFLLTGIYGYIYKIIVRRLHQQMPSKDASETDEDKSDRARKWREVRAAKRLTSIVVFFAICWMPLLTLNCIQAFVEFHVPPIIIFFVIILSHANSSVNPLMYAYCMRDFRTAMKKALLSFMRIMVPCRTWKLKLDSADQNTEASMTNTSNVLTEVPLSCRENQIENCCRRN